MYGIIAWFVTGLIALAITVWAEPESKITASDLIIMLFFGPFIFPVVLMMLLNNVVIYKGKK